MFFENVWQAWACEINEMADSRFPLTSFLRRLLQPFF